MKNNIKYILVHCSDVLSTDIFDQFKSINIYHRDNRFFPESSLGIFVGYNYLITGDKLYKCRENWEIGAHCNDVVDGISMNRQSIGICFGIDGDRELPSDTHLKLFKSLIDGLMIKYDIPLERVKFHRDYDTKGKTCPGTLFTRQYLESIIKPLSVPINIEKCNNEKIIIENQKSQIFNLQTFISNLIRFFNLK